MPTHRSIWRSGEIGMTEEIVIERCENSLLHEINAALNANKEKLNDDLIYICENCCHRGDYEPPCSTNCPGSIHKWANDNKAAPEAEAPEAAHETQEVF